MIFFDFFLLSFFILVLFTLNVKIFINKFFGFLISDFFQGYSAYYWTQTVAWKRQNPHKRPFCLKGQKKLGWRVKPSTGARSWRAYLAYLLVIRVCETWCWAQMNLTFFFMTLFFLSFNTSPPPVVQKVTRHIYGQETAPSNILSSNSTTGLSGILSF